MANKTISKGKIFAIVVGVLVVLFAGLSAKLFEDADRQKNYVVQMPVSGTYHYWTEGGLKWQGFGTVNAYSKATTIEFVEYQKTEDGYEPCGENPAAAITFNDNGKGVVIGSFQAEIPNEPEYLEKIQTKYGNEQAMIKALIKPTLYKVVTACGPLMSSLESVSATRTDLINYINDQLNSGVYKTKTTKVEVLNEFTEKPEVRTQAEILKNELGEYLRQEISPFALYGVRVSLVSVLDIKYDRATQNQINAQKDANLAQITARTKSEEAKQKTIQIEEEGKANAAKAKWEQETVKAVAVTKAQQEYEVAALEAKRAQQVALKVKAEGEAKAAANRALVAAGLTPAERAEWDYKTAVGVAEALANSKTRWVPEVIYQGGNSNGGATAMDAVGLNMLLDIVKKMNGEKK